MQFLRLCSLALLLGCGAFTVGQGQVSSQPGVSSDDISVADGLQLPSYGHIWALDTWQGLRELVRLKPPNVTDDQGFSRKLRRSLEFKGEAAQIRVHDPAPLFFLRGVSGSDNGRSDMVVLHLTVEGQRRTFPRDTLAELKQFAKNASTQLPGVVPINQQRVGSTDWYRLSPREVLPAGEYALIPLPSSPGFAEGEIFDFAIDPDAPENADPLRSEQYRGAQ